MQNTFQSKSLYYQLVEILKQRIENSMVAHDKLPSERELTSFYGVSRTTVRLALQELEKMGYIYRQHGKGTFVSELRTNATDLAGAYSFTEQMRAMGKHPETKILAFKKIEATKYLAGHMNVQLGEPLFQLDRLRLADDLPMMIEKSYLPVKLFMTLSRELLSIKPLYDLFSEDFNQTVRSAMYVLKNAADVAETIYYIYVVDTDNKLVGVISLRDLIINDEDTMIADILNERVMSVHVGDDQEDVAQTFRDYDFLALPVTDYDDHLLGIVTVDDIIDVIDDEAASDYSGLAGVNVEEVSENPLKASSRRLPWLITLLFLGMATASLISHYEELVSEASILAVFISLITGTAGNAGTQSLAVAVRRLAISDDKEKSFMRTVIGEVLTGLVTGAVTGLTIFAIVAVWKQNPILGFVIGMAMMCAITVANLAGSLIPMLMDKLGFDPAVASGPFITTLSDLTSVLIYFNIASLFMNYFIR